MMVNEITETEIIKWAYNYFGLDCEPAVTKNMRDDPHLFITNPKTKVRYALHITRELLRDGKCEKCWVVE